MCESFIIVWICYCTKVRVWENEKIDFSTHVNNHALVHVLKLKIGFEHMNVFMILWVWQNMKALSSCACACWFEWLLTVCQKWIINESTAEESLEAWGNAGNKPPSLTHFLTHQETESGGGEEKSEWDGEKKKDWFEEKHGEKGQKRRDVGRSDIDR